MILPPLFSTIAALLVSAATSVPPPQAGQPVRPLLAQFFPTQIGRDTNSADNPFIQPTDPALSGGGRDQSQQFFDLLFGHATMPNIMIGRLGADTLVGGGDTDIMIGGPEHFNPANRDRALGLYGDDVFLWSPGDGSDRFDGGPGLDTVVFGLIAERDPVTGAIVFRVSTDQKAGDVWLDPITGLPRIDVSGSPGFCRVIDGSTSPTARADLAAIDVDRLVQFFIRPINQAFNAGTQTTDNGLRVTLHLRDVEFLVCTSQAGGQLEAFDLRHEPPMQVPLHSVPFAVQYLAF